ncbi:MAG TPA: hypothetical protein VGM37_14870 [Armatimonadota bacterium]|jgi:hypothetical protein
MPIPNINLIPPAYYLRKKVRVAVATAVFADILVVGGLVAFAMMQTNHNQELKLQQTDWKARADRVDSTKAEAQTILSSVSDYTAKTDFIGKVFAANAKWATLFEAVRDYSYPQATYTTMKPTAGSNVMQLHISVPNTKEVTAQQALNLYWANLLRCPLVDTVLPSTNLGYPMNTQDNTASVSLGSPGMSGAPGGPPSPGGPPMPGGASSGRYLGSPMAIASPATGGAQTTSLLSGKELGGIDASVQIGENGQVTIGASSNPMYGFDITAQMRDSVTVPTFGAATQQQQQSLGGGL